MLTRIGNFLIDQWLWNVTWDWYHIPISVFVLTVFFKFFLRINVIASVLIALSSAVSSFITYTLFVVGGLIYLLNFRYEEVLQGKAMVADPLHACLYVGIIYTVLQAVFFVILNKYYPVQWGKMITAAFVANMVAAGLVYLVAPNPLV